MNYLTISFGLLITLAASRFIPHPPNFTNLIALSYYVPILLGNRFIPALILCFVITDFFIGFHSVTIFTWGSILVIGLFSNYLSKNILNRVLGVVIGCLIFFIISNFGVWSLGNYGYNFQGLITCYVLALPFFGYSLISTFIYSVIIESLYKINKIKIYLKLIKN
jgi:hypothetical protein